MKSNFVAALRRPLPLLSLTLITLAIGAVWFLALWDAPPPEDSDLAKLAAEEFDAGGGDNAVDALIALDAPFLEGYSRENYYLEAMLEGAVPFSVEAVEKVLAANAPALESLSHAAKTPGWDFEFTDNGRRYGHDAAFMLELARLKIMHAAVLREMGSHAASISAALELRLIARRILDSLTPSLSVLSTGQQIEEMSLQALMETASATEDVAAIRKTLRELLGHPATRLRAERHLAGEYLFFKRLVDRRQLATIYPMRPPRTVTMMPEVLFKPNDTLQIYGSLTRETIRNLRRPLDDQESSAFDAARAKTFSQRRALLSPNPGGRTILKEMLGMSRWVNRRSASTETAYAAAVAGLAARLSELEHGKPPGNAAALVPAYLPAVVADPFTGDPLLWNADRRIIWSAGPNRLDDAGEEDDIAVSFGPLPPRPEHAGPAPSLDSPPPPPRARRVILPPSA